VSKNYPVRAGTFLPIPVTVGFPARRLLRHGGPGYLRGGILAVSYPAMVRGEPGYTDQVTRRLAYEATHPDTEIIYLPPFWQAIIREPEGGMTVITRPSLEKLLNKLESL
jgi:hypothetical protein